MVCARLMHKKNTSKDYDKRDNNNNVTHFLYVDDLKVLVSS